MSDPSNTTSALAATELVSEKKAHFEFGRNWSRFLSQINEERIRQAQNSVVTLLHSEDLRSRRFLDAGSGSGLFSLAANRLGANVTSFDFDPESVACTREIRSRFAADPDRWNVLEGSLLDHPFLSSLGQFEVVYCWGVAHHTGQMWQAVENLTELVAPHGQLVLAIYNDQQFVSRGWRVVKRLYQRLPRLLRPVLVALIGLLTFLKRASATLVACALRLLTLRNPLVPILNWMREGQSRGMHVWYDLVDWVGGWPFEVARPEEVFRFLRDRGFYLQEMTTSSGHGCNEFVFGRERAARANADS